MIKIIIYYNYEVLMRGVTVIDNSMSTEIADFTLDDWQETVNLLAEIVGIPAALIMRLTGERIEVLVSSETEGNPYKVGSSELFNESGLYCEHVIKTREKLCIPNALKDSKWKDNPDIKLNMISYLGFPIMLPDKKPFGTICILDNKENKYSESVVKLMTKFRDLIEFHLHVTVLNTQMGEKNKRLSDYISDLQLFKGLVPICSNCKNVRESDNTWHPIEDYIFRHPEIDITHTVCPECIKKLYPEFYSSKDYERE